MKKSNLLFSGSRFFEFLSVIFFSCILFFIVFSCRMPGDPGAKRTKTEQGPFQPYGGKREITFNKDSIPIELKDYDAKGNLRKRITRCADAKNRTTGITEEVFDEKGNLVRGYKLNQVYIKTNLIWQAKQLTKNMIRKRKHLYW